MNKHLDSPGATPRRPRAAALLNNSALLGTALVAAVAITGTGPKIPIGLGD